MFRRLGGSACLAAVLVLAGCRASPPEKVPDALGLQPARFGDLPGWMGDDLSTVLPALLKSCAVLMTQPDAQSVGPMTLAGTVADWRPACARAATLPSGDGAAVRAFFETEFVAM